MFGSEPQSKQINIHYKLHRSRLTDTYLQPPLTGCLNASAGGS